MADRRGSNFSLSFWLLSPARRRAISALYEFCRAADEVADSPRARPRRALREWRRELARTYAGRPRWKVTQRLWPYVQAFGLPRRHLEELLDGVEMDLTKRRYRTWKELDRYCYRVASTVGLLCLRIFGAAEPRLRPYAVHLGKAFQYTNILRDVKEDLARGRIYLPQTELRRHRVRPADLENGRVGPGLQAVLAKVARRAQEHFRRAERILRPSDRPRLRAALAMAEVYREILSEMVRRGYPIFNGRFSLSAARRLFLAGRAFLRTV